MTLFNRKIVSALKEWAALPDKKPVILRGARQVGKTTAVQIFAKEFPNFVTLNLEKPGDLDLFNRNLELKDLFQAILLEKKIRRKPGKFLLFIDEIQQSPSAVSLLRYFYEDFPDISVIAAGSLFEIMLEAKQIPFPVGRVQFLFVYPLSFEEFLAASGNDQLLDVFLKIPLPKYGFEPLRKLFHTYTLIGGMPEVIARYNKTQNLLDLNQTYQSIFTAYKDDVTQYARNETMRHIIRHCIESTPGEAGKRITFSGFGSSNYRAREVGEALRSLERAMLLYILYPTTSTHIPVQPDKKKAPKLQFFDTGLLNFINGLQGYYFKYNDLHSFYKGILAEHIVTQEVIASNIISDKKPVFWVREKKQSSAEVDLVLSHKGYAVPLEIKSGKTGTLRSLHLYMDKCDHHYAVRCHSGPLKIDTVTTLAGKTFHLLNLPYFLSGLVEKYIDWFIHQVNK